MCIFSILQGNTQPRAAQQETTDVTTTGPPESDSQPGSSLGKTVVKTRDIGRPETARYHWHQRHWWAVGRKLIPLAQLRRATCHHLGDTLLGHQGLVDKL